MTRTTEPPVLKGRSMATTSELPTSGTKIGNRKLSGVKHSQETPLVRIVSIFDDTKLKRSKRVKLIVVSTDLKEGTLRVGLTGKRILPPVLLKNLSHPARKLVLKGSISSPPLEGRSVTMTVDRVLSVSLSIALTLPSSIGV